jgi:hypothetical protein
MQCPKMPGDVSAEGGGQLEDSGTGPPRPRGTEPQDASVTESLGALANMGWQILLTTGLAAIALGVVVLAWPKETPVTSR